MEKVAGNLPMASRLGIIQAFKSADSSSSWTGLGQKLLEKSASGFASGGEG